tara:strand:- start:309 stop:494 length:186 start_codon:yes stop_codon:yes gene_type:complete
LNSLDALGKAWRDYQGAQIDTDLAVDALRHCLAEERSAAVGAIRAALGLSAKINEQRGKNA